MTLKPVSTLSLMKEILICNAPDFDPYVRGCKAYNPATLATFFRLEIQIRDEGI